MAKKRIGKQSGKSRKVKVDCNATLMKASSAHRDGRFSEAEKGYLRVLKIKPGWGQVLNALGTVYLQTSRPEKAKQCFEEAASLSPPDLSACYNLARLKQQDNDHEAALLIYRKILAERPDFGEVWNNVGIACREIGNGVEALHSFQNAVKFAPKLAEAWNNLGVVQDEQEMYEDAIGSYQRAVSLRFDYISAYFNLGGALQKMQRFEEAKEHYEKVLEINPDDAPAMFMLKSLGTSVEIPDNAPVEHVRRIFDQCASSFEKILVNDLEYKTPELLFDIVSPYLRGDCNILDLGCGTGLGAQLYRKFARKLTGVDVSAKMLEKAKEKNVYDHLEVFDILQKWTFPDKFDLIYSSDVFVYLGNLEKILISISQHLAPGGILAFSVEKLNQSRQDYQLHNGGRYSHSRQYIQKCLKRQGFSLLEEKQSNIRKQSGIYVKGLLIVAKKD